MRHMLAVIMREPTRDYKILLWEGDTWWPGDKGVELMIEMDKQTEYGKTGEEAEEEEEEEEEENKRKIDG